MKHRESIELLSGALTLGVSLYVAFGPLRHRLPRVLTRFARLSATLKLLALSALCWFAIYKNVEHDGARAMRWGLTVLGLALIGGAVYVATRPASVRRVVDSRQVRRAKQARAERAGRKADGRSDRGGVGFGRA